MCCFLSRHSARENSTSATRSGRPVSMMGMLLHFACWLSCFCLELVRRSRGLEIESVIEVSENPLNFRLRQPMTGSSQLSHDKLRDCLYKDAILTLSLALSLL